MNTADLFQVKKASFSAHGKFLLTGEYAVLDNVDALAIPLKLDQRLNIESREDSLIQWTSYNADGTIWFEDSILLENLIDTRFKGDSDIAKKLVTILKTALKLVDKSNFTSGFNAITKLDFDRNSGMGTSSTLISMVSEWIGCDPYKLQFECFGGSGYDIACAKADSAIVYNYNDADPRVHVISYEPSFKDQLYFIYLNQKQDSRKSIASFNPELLTDEIRITLNEMPKRFLESEDDLEAFKEIIVEHEQIIGELIGVKPVKERLFADYSGAVKSLGGWGGDYILVTGTESSMEYFKSKGYHQIYRWDEVVLGN
ncbi:GYDIA family GHMP kinase [Nonlabens antarcticus]|uniref:GYDIA family GHMP kinase n=1 Tax=Nonlabens antarcticus TaxID=392714 RepID=UPI001890D2DC|nr:GYDIA family GHMP kinase [Nonlabens antarcticus]